MARHKDLNWNLPEGVRSAGRNVHSWDSIHSALLMDIRDQLQALNALLHCANFVSIPSTLRGIRRDVQRRRQRKVR